MLFLIVAIYFSSSHSNIYSVLSTFTLQPTAHIKTFRHTKNKAQNRQCPFHLSVRPSGGRMVVGFTTTCAISA